VLNPADPVPGAVLSASTCGYLYHSSLRESAVLEAERQALMRVETLRKNIAAYLSESIKPVRALAEMEELKALLAEGGTGALTGADRVLDLFNSSLEADVCYLMNPAGDTVASSNRDAPDSFVGENFAFRPYFQHAIRGRPHTYLALGSPRAGGGPTTATRSGFTARSPP
jgi:C4-dicarboxylate-specific signal transduction histidine kinase